MHSCPQCQPGQGSGFPSCFLPGRSSISHTCLYPVLHAISSSICRWNPRTRADPRISESPPASKSNSIRALKTGRLSVRLYPHMDGCLEPLRERLSGFRPLCGGVDIVDKPHIWNHNTSVFSFETQPTFQDAGD